MQHKTKGIVLKKIKYRETSIITNIYTEEFGVQSYIVNNVRSSKPKTRIALFQPLTLLDLVVYYKPTGGIQRISELKCSYPYGDIPFNIRKSSIMIFLAEVFSKSIREETGNASMFQFLEESLIAFDHLDDNYENFHLQILLKLSRFMGFAPSSGKQLLDQINEAKESRLGKVIDTLFNEDYTNGPDISYSDRKKILGFIVAYYQIHVENLNRIKSIGVLSEVLKP